MADERDYAQLARRAEALVDGPESAWLRTGTVGFNENNQRRPGTGILTVQVSTPGQAKKKRLLIRSSHSATALAKLTAAPHVFKEVGVFDNRHSAAAWILKFRLWAELKYPDIVKLVQHMSADARARLQSKSVLPIHSYATTAAFQATTIHPVGPGMGAMAEVLGCHDLLVRVLSFAPTSFDLGRCAVVNTAFRAASATAGALLAARTQPAVAALQQSGAFDLNREGLGLRIARAFAVEPEDTFSPEDPPFVPDEYTMLIQVRDSSKGGAVCFSSSGIVTEDIIHPSAKIQSFDNEVTSAEHAESDSFWKVYCEAVNEHAAEAAEEGLGEFRSESTPPEDVDRMKLYLVLVRKSDGAVHQLRHGLLVDVEYDWTDYIRKQEAGRVISFAFIVHSDELDIAHCFRDGHFMVLVDMRADDREGASWKHVHMNLMGDEILSLRCADDLAQMLKSLQPWVK
jgi:hypothetical protein